MGGNPAEGGNGGRMDDVAEALNERQRGILDEVLGLIRDVLAEDWIEDAVFDEHTSFAGDLNIESIEIVALAEAIHDRYGEDVNLAGLVRGDGYQRRLAARSRRSGEARRRVDRSRAILMSGEAVHA